MSHYTRLFGIVVALCYYTSNSFADPFYTPGIDHQTAISQTTHQDATPANNPKEQGQLLYRVALQHLEAIDYHSAATGKSSSQDVRDHGVVDTAALAIKSILDKAVYSIWIATDQGPEEVSKEEPPLQDDDHLRLALTMLEKASKTYGNDDALYLLAEINFFAKYGHPRNYSAAFDYYRELAATGNATAQQMVAFVYATGIGHAVERDQAQALLYHTFAAHGGDTAAEMTLGYRHLLGIGTEQKCQDALYYYQRVAEKAIEYFLSGPPGGHTQPPAKIRLSDEVGGVYGYGASVMTDRRHRASPTNSERSVSIDEVLQYWRYMAQTKGDFEAQLMLGQIYYQGTRSIHQDYREAYFFFKQVVDKLTSIKISDTVINSKRGRAIGQAAGYLGKMHWRGEGVDADPEIAYQWFYIGAELGDSICQNGLGMMYLDGIVVPKSREKAIEYFKLAASQENPEAQVNLAMEYVKQESTLTNAIRYFTLAAEAKHPLAQWYLANLHQAGIGLPKSCQMAVSLYKSIAERCDWLHPIVETAYTAYMNGKKEDALLYYMIAAEHGYEIAQSNVAYMLDTYTHLLKLQNIFETAKVEERDRDTEEYALIYWSRSANQNNVDSRVKMGDYYFRGIGTDVDYEKAAACYRIAAEIELSPMAMWNLGWMYENGLGVPKDFHLAKRWYDNAVSTNPDAYLPVKLSLMKLYLRYYWGWITRTETGQDLLQDESKPPSSQQGNEETGSGSAAAKAAAKAAAAAQEARRRQEIEAYEYERAHWEIGTEEELRRKYSKHMKRLEREEDDYLDVGSGNSEYDRDSEEEYSEEDELIESLMILGLCVLVGWLVYMRQFRFGNNNNNNNQGIGDNARH